MPSVSASWGSTRHPRPNRCHVPAGGSRSSTVKPTGTGCSIDSAAVSVHTLYTSRPPGLTSGAETSMIRRCRATRSAMSAGWIRQRASGRRRSAPSPLHGASISTASNASGSNGGSVASATTDSTPVRPSRSTFSEIRRTRPGRTSAATTDTPTPASAVALPPGAAHVSSTRSPATASTAAATHCDEMSCTYPSARMVIEPASFMRASERIAASSPSSSTSSRPIQSGELSRANSDGHTMSVVDALRSTALTNPRTRFGASPTVSPTAAWGGTPANSNWYTPSRRRVRVAGSGGDVTNRSINASHARRIRVVP